MVRARRTLQIGTVLAFAATTIGTVARADVPAEALRAFGLLGTWSDDCAAPVAAGGPGFRLIFTISADGTATEYVLSSGATGSARIGNTVVSAAPVGAAGIKLDLSVTGGDRNGGPPPMKSGASLSQVLERAGPDRINLYGKVLIRCPTP